MVLIFDRGMLVLLTEWKMLTELELLGSCPPPLESQCVTVEGGHCVLEAHLVKHLFTEHSQQGQEATLNI